MDRIDAVALRPVPSSEAGPSPAGSLVVEAGGASLVLLPERALWWPEQRMLLVADLHLGKAQSFRRLGVPVPHGTTAETLQALDALLQRHRATRLVCLGDFLHSAHAQAPGVVGAVGHWRARHPALAVTLVRGNHDRHAGDPPRSLGLEIVDEPWVNGPLALCHHPRPRPGVTVLAGHLHPCVSVGGRAHERLRLPCFVADDGLLVLPAFGAFTGMHPVERQPGRRIYAIAGDRVAQLPATA